MILLLAGAAASVPAVRFVGALRAGERFERSFSDSLRFVVEPDDDGWTLRVRGTDSLADYAGIVTPPFHGPNPVQIQAWHFARGPDGGAPGRARGFRFVTCRRDYERAQALLDVMLWPSGRSDASVDSAAAAFDSLRVGEGEIRITDLSLRAPGAGMAPRLDWIRFRVELRMPRPR